MSSGRARTTASDSHHATGKQRVAGRTPHAVTSKAEQETIIRWDQEDPDADLYTAHPAQARRWAKQGYPVEVVDCDGDGNDRGWRCRVPKDAVRFRRVQDGQVVKRRTGAGRQFRAIDGASEEPTACGELSISQASGDAPESRHQSQFGSESD